MEEEEQLCDNGTAFYLLPQREYPPAAWKVLLAS